MSSGKENEGSPTRGPIAKEYLETLYQRTVEHFQEGGYLYDNETSLQLSIEWETLNDRVRNAGFQESTIAGLRSMIGYGADENELLNIIAVKRNVHMMAPVASKWLHFIYSANKIMINLTQLSRVIESEDRMGMSFKTPTKNWYVSGNENNCTISLDIKQHPEWLKRKNKGKMKEDHVFEYVNVVNSNGYTVQRQLSRIELLENVGRWTDQFRYLVNDLEEFIDRNIGILNSRGISSKEEINDENDIPNAMFFDMAVKDRGISNISCPIDMTSSSSSTASSIFDIQENEDDFGMEEFSDLEIINNMPLKNRIKKIDSMYEKNREEYKKKIGVRNQQRLMRRTATSIKTSLSELQKDMKKRKLLKGNMDEERRKVTARNVSRRSRTARQALIKNRRTARNEQGQRRKKKHKKSRHKKQVKKHRRKTRKSK
tara:strand:+ start:1403 stop:2689 length:1287 start_codon:yes stop_codon:yes gene_type:complete